MAKQLDMSNIVKALNDQKGAVQSVVADGNTNATPQKNASDIDVLGGAILLLADFILDGNEVDFNQEKRLQVVENAINKITTILEKMSAAPEVETPEAPETEEAPEVPVTK